MSNAKSLLILTIALIFTGCAKETGVTYTPPPIENDWIVTMNWSGGIAGVSRNIAVRSDGSYAVVDEVNGQATEGELTEAQRAELEGILFSLEFNAPKIPSACADCFVYDIEIDSGGKRMLVNVDDVSLGNSGAGPLVQFLSGLITSALQ